MSIKKNIPFLIKKVVKKIRGLSKYNLDFLAHYDDERLGPLQTDEAIFLYGLLKVTRPKVVVEFGFLEGHSSLAILSAIDAESKLYSYDISEYSKKNASEAFHSYVNFKFYLKSQVDFEPGDIDNQKINFVLIDASHDLDLNQATFIKIHDSLAENALVMIHDTGLWNKKFMKTEHFALLDRMHYKWISDEYVAHQVEERMFVNWITENYPDFVVLNFESANLLRHGFSLLGKRKKLEV